ncbi:T9SS type A sorting domain-containing protein [Taibaiella soli]|uniref:PKD domain-containing protein n=1 Tax=Taibaiella soli TaxID=1649169 RepID=A0A2W2BE05_9BACT|nr:T9SS type A sorting domain-containing protein [Taibaiella soli]PZF74499.1 hypothetical protein DN068_02675 [Taibaiella soli]
MKTIILAFCIALTLVTPTQAQMYFTQNGAGTMDGSSWTNAKPGTQLAPMMRFFLSSWQLWVAAGTYKVNTNVRDSSFFINSQIKVYGGFAGTETSISQRNIAANPTILSGNIGSLTDSTDNCYHVVQFMNADSTTILDGFIIEGGYADNLANWNNLGGGIRNWATSQPTVKSSPQISNCIIRNNYADMGGGGMVDFATYGHANSHVTNTLFEGNIAGTSLSGGNASGGGGFLALSYLVKGANTAYFDSCIFRNNLAQSGGGGAISLAANVDNNGTLTVKNCTFDHNKGNTGAVSLSSLYDLYDPNTHTAILKQSFENCRFTQNIVSSQGGGVITTLYFKPAQSTMSLVNCTIDSNTGGFAPIYENNNAVHSKNLFDRVTIHHNEGFYSGGLAIWSRSGSIDTTTINNCLLYNSGKGILVDVEALEGSDIYTFMNNTTLYDDSARQWPYNYGLFNNVAGNSSGSGPAHAIATINNSIIWYNRGNLNPAFNICKSLAITKNGSFVTANIYTKNSLINLDQNVWPVPYPNGQLDYGTNMGGNVSGYPRFLDTATGNLRLGCSSPGLNSGSNALIPSDMLTDIEGNNRILHNTVDMGCYETDTLPTPLANTIITVDTANSSITCTAGYNMQPDSVVWHFGDGQNSNAMNPTHTYAAPGTYNVCLKIFTACGIDEKCDSVKIPDTTSATPPTPPSNTGINNNSLLNNISIYPNPAHEQLFISGLKESVKVCITSLTGQLLQTSTLSAGNNQLNISSLPAGVYLLQLKTDTGERKTVKIVVNRDE